MRVLRELQNAGEFNETVDVAKAAWGFRERELSPAGDLIAATHAGGLTAGAFEGKTLLGFVHGFPRTNVGRPCQHSHLLAVRPTAQGRGIARSLKLFQREWCLARGIRLVTWTYDPFLVKNARLNLARLRATVVGFLPNFYGPMGGIYGSLPTDRFEVAWRLDDPIVERAVREAGQAAFEPDTSGLKVATPRHIPQAARVGLTFPAGAPGVYRTETERILRERKGFARCATALFVKGYEATGIVTGPRGPMYVLERP